MSKFSTPFVFGASARLEAERRAERQARRVAGLPVYSKPVVVDFGDRRRVAQNSSVCAVCSGRVERGLLVRPAGWGRVAHVECMDSEVGKCGRGPVARVGFRSAATEARRRVFWAVECPECFAGSGKACVKPSGARRARNHVRRVLAYSKAKRARVVQDSVEAVADLEQAVRALFVEPVEVVPSGGVFEGLSCFVGDPWASEFEWASLRL